MFEAFRDAEGYYSTLAHETTHWTSHASRLARDVGSKRFAITISMRTHWPTGLPR
jgi:antirestriction protein ArdC